MVGLVEGVAMMSGAQSVSELADAVDVGLNGRVSEHLNALEHVFSRSENTLFRFFNDWRKNVTFSNNTWIAEGESLCRFHGRPTANLVYKYPDRLDQMHDDNLAEIESQTVTAPRVFSANERAALATFLKADEVL